jgi:hypothetical protein
MNPNFEHDPEALNQVLGWTGYGMVVELKPDTVGVEWIRHEPHPKANEPSLNVNRYLFGLSPDGQKCWGYEVTANPVPGTVFPHWPKDFESLWAQHFPGMQEAGDAATTDPTLPTGQM